MTTCSPGRAKLLILLRLPSCRHDMYMCIRNPNPVAFRSCSCLFKIHPDIYARHLVHLPFNELSSFELSNAELDSADRYARILQKCRQSKDLALASRIYEHIHGSALETHKIVGNQVVQVLAESGRLADAQRVFDHLASRNVLSWTALISGYIKAGRAYHAFSLYYMMLEDNVEPSSYTFVALLSTCTKLKDMGKGKEFHGEAVQRGFEQDFYVASTLVDMYAKSGLLLQAREVFDKLSVRDVVLWNALITGYSEHGLGEEALKCYKCMQLENLSSTVVTFLGLLKACCMLGAFEKGLELHSEVVQKAFETDAYIASTLVDMYAKCGSLLDAENVFDGLAVRCNVSWNALITGYAEHGHGEEVLKKLEQMQSEGIFPDAVTFIYGLKACGILVNIGRAREMHKEIVERGFEKDFVLGSMLLDTYSKCGYLLEAQDVFDKLLARDVVSWTALIAGYAEHGPHSKALDSFDQMQFENVSPNAVTLACVLKACSSSDGLIRGWQMHKVVAKEGYEVDLLVNSALINMYVKHGLLSEAREIFDTMPKRDTVLWNTLLNGYVENGLDQEAINLVEGIQLNVVSPDAATYACALKACSNVRAIDKGQELNLKILLLGYETDMFISSMLMEMYAKCNCLPEASYIFGKLASRDVVSWNVLIVTLLEHGCSQEALSCFERMLQDNVSADCLTFASILKACSNMIDLEEGQKLHIKAVLKGFEGDLFVGSSLVDLYAKCGYLSEASDVFKKIPVRDDVLWNAILAGHVDNGFDQEAFACFEMMQSENLSPSAATVICMLKASGNMGAVKRLQEMHMEIIRKGFERDLLVGNTLVDTYGKCGCLQEALKTFDTLVVKDVTSWNAMIKGSGMNHEGSMAMQYLKGLLETGLKPDATTFTCLLTACSRASLVLEGQDFFKVMREDFGIVPAIDHVVCMIDLLARSGCLYEAEKLMETLPNSPNTNTWTTLLSASKTFEEMELGSRCFLQLASLNAGFVAPSVTMENSISSLEDRQGSY